MIKVTIKSNHLDLIGRLKRTSEDQIPFASALALTRLAQAAQADTRGHLASIFTIRSTWVSRGIQIRSASKRDWPLMSAEIGTRDDFMEKQADGGVKRGRNGNQIAVPLAARPTPLSVTKPSQWPGPILRRHKGFLRTLKHGRLAGKLAVMQRDSTGLHVMYVVKPSVIIRKRWPFTDDVTALVQRDYDKAFGTALAQAIASRK